MESEKKIRTARREVPANLRQPHLSLRLPELPNYYHPIYLRNFSSHTTLPIFLHDVGENF